MNELSTGCHRCDISSEKAVLLPWHKDAEMGPANLLSLTDSGGQIISQK